MTLAIIPTTAQKIVEITRSQIDPNAVTLIFEDGKDETFLDWFVQKHKPAVGRFLAKDVEGFTHVIDGIEA